MKKEIINTNKISGTYANSSAHGVKAGNFLFVTGQYASSANVNPKDDRFKSYVGKTVTILKSSATFPSRIGTLKSTRIRIRFDFKSNEVSVFNIV